MALNLRIVVEIEEHRQQPHQPVPSRRMSVFVLGDRFGSILKGDHICFLCLTQFGIGRGQRDAKRCENWLRRLSPRFFARLGHNLGIEGIGRCFQSRLCGLIQARSLCLDRRHDLLREISDFRDIKRACWDRNIHPARCAVSTPDLDLGHPAGTRPCGRKSCLF